MEVGARAGAGVEAAAALGPDVLAVPLTRAAAVARLRDRPAGVELDDVGTVVRVLVGVLQCLPHLGVGELRVAVDDVVERVLEGTAGLADRGCVVGVVVRRLAVRRVGRRTAACECEGAGAGHPGVGEVGRERARHVDLLAHQRWVRPQAPLAAERRRDLDVEHLRRARLAGGVGDRERVVVGEAAGHDRVGRGRLADDVAADGLGRSVLLADRLADGEWGGGLGGAGARGGEPEREEKGHEGEREGPTRPEMTCHGAGACRITGVGGRGEA